MTPAQKAQRSGRRRGARERERNWGGNGSTDGCERSLRQNTRDEEAMRCTLGGNSKHDGEGDPSGRSHRR